MSKAAELAALIGSQTALSNRNLVINGAMQVAQRGDVTGKTSSSYGGPDRFRLGISGAGTHSISQSTTVPSGSGFSNSWKLDCTVADTTPTLMAAQYRFEGHDLQQLKKGTSSAQSVTVSFWVRSNVTGTYVLEWQDKDNTRHIAKTYTISAANTFEYKTLTFAGDTSGTIDDNNGHSMELSWWLAASSTYTSGTLPSSWAAVTNANRAAGLNVNIAGDTANEWLITGVQLEVGEQATPFEHRSYGDEFSKCCRYYQQATYLGGSAVAIGHQSSSSGAQASVDYPHGHMRTGPTITMPAGGQGNNLLTFLKADTNYPTTTGTNNATKPNTNQFFVSGTGYAGLNGGGLATWLYTGGGSGSVTFKYDAEL